MFGAKLRKVRQSRGLSQKQLAKKMKGVYQPKISSWEKGKSRPTADQVVELVKILECDMLLILYKYSSPIYKYLLERFFQDIEIETHLDFLKIAEACRDVLDMTIEYGYILSGWESEDEEYYSDAEKLSILTSRLSRMVRVLDDIAHDFIIWKG